jgi:transcriptional regulator
MHPNKAFAWTDTDAMRAFVEETGFAHLFAMTGAGPIVAHVPLVVIGENFRFHLARSNRLTPHLDGARILASVVGVHGYVSPDWYAQSANQVPTWNYVVVEIEATAHALGEAELLDQIDRLSHVHESRLAPKPEWTRAKLSDVAEREMVAAIQAFELRSATLRGTRKLSQNKPQTDRDGVVAALLKSGGHDLAAWMRDQ